MKPTLESLWACAKLGETEWELRWYAKRYGKPTLFLYKDDIFLRMVDDAASQIVLDFVAGLVTPDMLESLR